jgi:hypothetical protein
MDFEVTIDNRFFRYSGWQEPRRGATWLAPREAQPKRGGGVMSVRCKPASKRANLKLTQNQRPVKVCPLRGHRSG